VLQGDGGIDYLLGIAPTGLVIYRNSTKIVSHFWSVDLYIMLLMFLLWLIVAPWLAKYHNLYLCFDDISSCELHNICWYCKFFLFIIK